MFFYRMCAVDEARRLCLCGWVRNLHDGNVELVAEGGAEAVEAMVEWCRKGPPYAGVTGVTVEHCEVTGTFEGFEIRR